MTVYLYELFISIFFLSYNTFIAKPKLKKMGKLIIHKYLPLREAKAI